MDEFQEIVDEEMYRANEDRKRIQGLEEAAKEQALGMENIETIDSTRRRERR